MIIFSTSNLVIILSVSLLYHDSNALGLELNSTTAYDGIDSLLNTVAITNFFESGDVPNLQNVISQFIADGDMDKFNLGVNNEDKDLNITQLISKYGYGYIVETHQIETSDGYILTVFRIRGNGPSVFLMHGIFCSSDDWVTVGPNSALPYLLAELGYDVWLGNARGNKHSRRHACSSKYAWLSTDSTEYWDFSWDEIGRYDLPATIDYILEITGHTKISYIGHSQGTTAYFVMCSERPEYNEKISVMIAFAVVAEMCHLPSPVLRLLSHFTTVLSDITAVLGLKEILPNDAWIRAVTQGLCGSTELGTILCSDVLFLFTGFDFAQLNVTNMPVVFSHLPGGASTKQVIHYAQEMESCKFRKFDYGPITNIIKYNSATPPDYNVANITAPMAIVYSPADWLSSLIDVETFVSELPDGVLVGLYKVSDDDFSHTDYLFAKDVKKFVYDKAMDILGHY